MSIKYKIALLFASLVSIILVVVSVSIYFFSVKERHDAFERRLRIRAITTASVYRGITQNIPEVLKRMDQVGVASLYNKSVSIIESDESHWYMYSDLPGDSLILSNEAIAQTKTDEEYYYNYRNKRGVALSFTDSTGNYIVAVAAEDADGNEYLGQLKKVLGIATALAVGLSFVTGLIFSKSLIRPMVKIMQEVNLISSNNLSQRIETSGTKDELNKLAQTFNNLLDRLQESFATQRRFISNASHELSTPLTSISSQLEVSKQRERTVEEYKEVISSVHDDVLELQQLTHSLLDIAKAGSQGGIELNEVRLDEVLFKVIKDVEKHNSLFSVKLAIGDFPEEEKLLTVFGSANLLYIALKNVIENGCKYSDTNQSAVTADFGEKEIRITIFNKGDIIAESDIQNIFQPFFRTDSARTKPGFGLGLTLSKRIVSIHRGQLNVHSDPATGTSFVFQLPNVSAMV